MYSLSKIDERILNVLYSSSRGLDAFSLFKRSEVSFPDFSKALAILSEAQLVGEPSDDFFVISQSGRQLLLTKRKTKNSREWRTVPSKFLGPKQKENKPYIPSLKKLDKKSFKVDID
ncbi:hypothetical protein KUW04_08900 [Halomonas denitrificans]|nr:hypothetical protein [Halomonas denitrificans]